MAKAVYCLASDNSQARGILEMLQKEGFSNNDISVLWPDKENEFGVTAEKSTKAPEGSVTGATTGGVLGGILGWLAGVGALAIPGIGPFVAAGPLMAMLGGAALGASVGGVTGALVGLGIPEYEAKRYEQGLREGKVLIACHTETDDEAKRIESMFKTAGASDVSTTHDKSRSDLRKEEEKAFEKQRDVDLTPPRSTRSDVFTGTNLPPTDTPTRGEF
jgi:hypothetical protein